LDYKLIDEVSDARTGQLLWSRRFLYAEVYSLATGVKEGEIFSGASAYCKTTDRITVRGGNDNELAIYDLNSREKWDEFTFSSGVVFDQFSRDGKRLFVLINDQTAYILDVSNSAGSPGDQP
jgi:WD40 repeat protein